MKVILGGKYVISDDETEKFEEQLELYNDLQTSYRVKLNEFKLLEKQEIEISKQMTYVGNKMRELNVLIREVELYLIERHRKTYITKKRAVDLLVKIKEMGPEEAFKFLMRNQAASEVFSIINLSEFDEILVCDVAEPGFDFEEDEDLQEEIPTTSEEDKMT